ncbi:MAG: hypothetical protein ACRDG7_11385 [Candidatus Limnocylindria bacterium]
MGRLGRACLYASFSLGATTATVLAASQHALPGQALYPLKQGIEELRVEILPNRFHAELAAYALGERIDEMGRLSAAGQDELAAALVPAIDREYQRLVAFGEAVGTGRAVRFERHMLVLEGLIERLPATARSAVEKMIDGTQGEGEVRTPPLDVGSGGRGNPGPGDAAGSEPAAPADPGPTASPDRTPKPHPTAKPERTPKPAPSAKPGTSSNPEATQRPGRTRP